LKVEKKTYEGDLRTMAQETAKEQNPETEEKGGGTINVKGGQLTTEEKNTKGRGDNKGNFKIKKKKKTGLWGVLFGGAQED